MKSDQSAIRELIFKKFKHHSKEEVLSIFVDLLEEADSQIIKAVGNGAKWPMVSYWDGVVIKLLKFLKIRKVDDLCPGHTYLKNETKKMRLNPIFLKTRSDK